MRLQRAAGKGRIVHDDLHAFSTGGILFVNNGALRKERVSDGHFSQQLEKWAKEPFETDGFKTFFPLKSFVYYRS